MALGRRAERAADRVGAVAVPPPRRFPVTSGFAHKKRANRCEFVRVRLVQRAERGWTAEKFPRDGAGILTSMVESDGLVEIGEGISRIEAGQSVDFLPFSEVIE